VKGGKDWKGRISSWSTKSARAWGIEVYFGAGRGAGSKSREQRNHRRKARREEIGERWKRLKKKSLKNLQESTSFYEKRSLIHYADIRKTGSLA
jgi:hypothetical protein